VRSPIAVIAALNKQVKILHGQVEADFGQHSDAEIYRSQPGLGAILGARVPGCPGARVPGWPGAQVPGEFGDGPGRYADGKCRRNYARGLARLSTTPPCGRWQSAP
jgi:hypothetical protein